MRHRGPDGEGIHEDRTRIFASVRLAILDRAGGQQPIYNQDATVGIVYNGEIYNHGVLRRELEARGRAFRTKTDTEVVVQAFEEWGTDAFTKLSGMFAFALWDATTTYLVRDVFGIKPLYLYRTADAWIFASELGGLLAWSEFDFSLSAEGVSDYLTYRYIPWPNTILSGVRRLAPGEVVAIGEDGERTLEQMKLAPPLEADAYADGEALHADLRHRLADTVAGQLMGEVPIGVCLSGGVDSSIVAHCLNEVGAKLKAFSIGFEEVNEFRFSRSLVRRYDLDYEEHTLTLDQLVQLVPDFLSAIDEPIADPACLPLLHLAREMRKSVTVVLSGEGGDELFCGYPQYADIHNRFPHDATDRAYTAFLDRSWYFTDIGDLFNGRGDSIKSRRFLFDGNGLLDRMSRYDMATWVPDNLMMKADKILMSESLEGRFPFLTPQIWSLAAGLPSSMRISETGVTKAALKEAYRDRLPRSIIARPKMGFTVPVDKLLERLGPMVEDALAQESGLERFVNKARLQELWREFRSGRTELGLRLWTVLVLHLWCLMRGRWRAG